MSLTSNQDNPANAGDFVSEKDLGLTADGKVVDQSDERCATVLVAKGGTLSGDVAAKHGLTKPGEAESKAVKAAPENKAVSMSDAANKAK